jgi:hypothetical protein
MSRLALILVALCLFGVASPARALGTLQFCDNVTNPGERMACLQAHISNLEETLLTLNNRIITLEKALDEKLSADGVYKLQHVGRGFCLGVASEDTAPKLASCDEPDSWKLLTGSQRPGRAAKGQSKSDDDADKNKDKDKDKDKDKEAGKKKGKKSDTSEQSKSTPAPAQ